MRPEEEGAVANLLSPSEWSPGGEPAYNDTFVEVVGQSPQSRRAQRPFPAPESTAGEPAHASPSQ